MTQNFEHYRDVRGWRGSQQAVAVIKYDAKDAQLQWWVSKDFQFRTGHALNLASLLVPAIGSDFRDIIDDAEKIVIGIDAPLAFPKAFTKLLTVPNSRYVPSATEIENPLAYRECERWVFQQYSKKPLSAPFDKLGNGATLAISLAHTLNQENFNLVPQQALESNHAIIEVYPGIHKVNGNRASPAIEPIHKLVPTGIDTGTDQYDAALCAITSLVFAGVGSQLGLPDLVRFPSNFATEEGWVYGLPADFIHSFQ